MVPKGGEAESERSKYENVNSVLCWDMINIVLRIWLQMVDTGGKQKKGIDWDMQEVSIQVLRYDFPYLFLLLSGSGSGRSVTDSNNGLAQI